jgi:AcrR family transcriptional regulator
MRPTKRDELVRKALAVFYRHGFHATGMDRLVAETGISKTSMYKHFRSKDDLILATLRLRDEEFRNWFTRRIEALAPDARTRLLAIYDVLGEWFDGKGFSSCMFIKASGEYPDASDPIHALAVEHKRLLENYVIGLAAEAGASEPQTLARQLILLAEGAIVTAHLLGTANVAQPARAAAKVLIDNAITGKN